MPAKVMSHRQSIEKAVEYFHATVFKKFFQIFFSLRRRPSEIILPEINLKLFQRLIAAHEYFSTCSMSLKSF